MAWEEGRGAGKCKCCVATTVVVLVLLMACVVLPMVFSYVEYYEYGFVLQRSTSDIKVDRIYEPGRYALGPDFTFKTFRSDGHHVHLKDMGIATRDEMEMEISVTFYYFLREDDLAYLFRTYGEDYDPVIISTATDAIKGRTVDFDTVVFVNNRSVVEQSLRTTLEERLNGKCCTTACKKSVQDCYSGDRGFFVEVRYFHLEEVSLPDRLESSYLEALTLLTSEDTEKLRQLETLTKKETEAQTSAIKVETEEIEKMAGIEAAAIIANGKNNGSAILETARIEGLQLFFDTLGVPVTDAQKRSFEYLRTLRELGDGAHLAVAFQQLNLWQGNKP